MSLDHVRSISLLHNLFVPNVPVRFDRDSIGPIQVCPVYSPALSLSLSLLIFPLFYKTMRTHTYTLTTCKFVGLGLIKYFPINCPKRRTGGEAECVRMCGMYSCSHMFDCIVHLCLVSSLPPPNVYYIPSLGVLVHSVPICL